MLRALLAGIARGMGLAEITPETSIVEELGLDSLKLLELTLAIETNLALTDFPMQDWYDAEAAKDGARFTVESLAGACERFRINWSREAS